MEKKGKKKQQKIKKNFLKFFQNLFLKDIFIGITTPASTQKQNFFGTTPKFFFACDPCRACLYLLKERKVFLNLTQRYLEFTALFFPLFYHSFTTLFPQSPLFLGFFAFFGLFFYLFMRARFARARYFLSFTTLV